MRLSPLPRLSDSWTHTTLRDKAVDIWQLRSDEFTSAPDRSMWQVSCLVDEGSDADPDSKANRPMKGVQVREIRLKFN